MLGFAAVLLALPLLGEAFVVAAVEGPRSHSAGKPKRNARFVSRTTLATCPVCADREPERGSLQSAPCGKSNDETPSHWVFHYGANMGCKKLSAIKVVPRSAQAVYIPGRCLRFGSAEGVPTSATEPAFGNLVPCSEGCVHGMVHEIPESQLSKIHATEPGYKFAELPEVISYDGKHLTGVKAYIMQKNMTAAAPSRRYGGLLYCTAKAELAPAYAEQLSCELADHGIRYLKCSSEKFVPLAAQSGSVNMKLSRILLAAVVFSAVVLLGGALGAS